MRERLLELMEEMLERNTKCDYDIVIGEETIELCGVYAIDAYLYACNAALKSKKNVNCFISCLGKRAISPVLQIIKGKILLNGVGTDLSLYNDSGDLVKLTKLYTVMESKSQRGLDVEYVFS